MKKLSRFTLKQFVELMQDDGNSHVLDDYIAENLLVARNPPIARLMASLSGDTVVMPEMRVMILTHGHANPLVNLTERHLEAGQMVFMSHNSIVKPQGYSDDISGFGLSLTDEIMSLAFPTGVPRMFDGRIRDCCFMLTPAERRQMEDIHTLLYNVLHSEQASPQVILSLTEAFLWQANSFWSRHEAENRISLSREQRLFADFVQLVSQYAMQEHHIDFYAQRLFLSPRYMSTLVKQVSGKAAKQWIDDAITTRIKVELRHTNKSAAQIADDMNFPNASFFCKYFKRMTGMTTQAYREKG